MQNSINKALRLAEKLNDEGKYEDALQIIFALEQKIEITPLKQISCDLIKGSSMVRIGRYNEVTSLSERIAQESQKLGEKIHIVDAFILKAKALYWLRRLDEGLEILDQCERLLKNLTDKSPLEIKQREAWIAWCRGVIYRGKSERELELKHLEQGLELGKETGNNQVIFLCLMLISGFYVSIGENDRALFHIEQSLEIAKLMQNHTITAWSYDALAWIHYEKGELDKSINYLRKNYKVFKQTNNNLHLSGTLSSFGYIYLQKGEIDRALIYFKRSLDMYEEIGEVKGICNVLSSLIHLTLDECDFKQAHFYFDRLKCINKKEENQKFSNLLYKLNKALIFKKDPQVMNHSKATNLLKQLINEEFMNFNIYITSLLELCDLLLKDLKSTNSLKIFDILQPYVDQLVEFAKKFHSYWLLAETYLLQAKLETITLDLNEAQRSLIKAHQIAEKYGLNLLSLRILNEQAELEEQFNKWENFKISKAIIADRIELAHIDEQLLRMLRKRVHLEKVIF